MKVIIAGGRDYNSLHDMGMFFKYWIGQNEFKERVSEGIEIVSGGAKGADSLAKTLAELNNYSYKEFPADWHTHGKSAGPIRNEEMAKYAEACIVFWDGESRGTKNMIKQAERYNLPLKIVKYKIDEKGIHRY